MTTYLQDSEGTFIPASQRPDGTWRKARRVKDGYVPQEEVPLYESKGKFLSRKPTYPVGISAEEIKQNKERKLKLGKQQEKDIALASQHNARIPGIINTKQCNLGNIEKQQQQQKSKTKSKNDQKNKQQSNVHNNQNKTCSTSSEGNIQNATEALSNLQLDPQQELTKKLKKLRKKIREIEAIELKLSNGELKFPEKDQLDKVGRKQEILKQISELETN